MCDKEYVITHRDACRNSCELPVIFYQLNP